MPLAKMMHVEHWGKRPHYCSKDCCNEEQTMSALSRIFGPDLWHLASQTFTTRQHFIEVAYSETQKTTPSEQAILGGFLADRLAYAFLSGYQSALSCLYPEQSKVACLCVTEEGGGHPRAIKTSLSQSEDGSYRLSGTKQWSTLADEAHIMLVAASLGIQNGRNRLKLVKVRSKQEGIRLEPMPKTGYVPEIKHFRIHINNLQLTKEDILPGDGYSQYIKPFRTLEDIYVGAATAAYLLKVAIKNDWPNKDISALSALITNFEYLANADPKAISTHIAVDGAMENLSKLIVSTDNLWSQVDSDSRNRWTRDKGLLKIAGRAREARFKRALKGLGK